MEEMYKPVVDDYCDELDRMVEEALPDELERKKMMHKIGFLINMYQKHADWRKVKCLERQRERILLYSGGK